MDRFARELDAWITREQDHGPECECGNSLHYELDRELGACEDCRDEAAAADASFDAARREEIVRARCEATIAQVTSRAWLAASKRTAAHYELALDCDADALFVGAATEAPVSR